MSAHIFGLDIGRSFIKVIEVDRTKNSKILKAAALTLTPSGGMETDSEEDLAKVSQEIKVCLKKAKTSTPNCVASLSESQVISRLVEMPILTDKELGAAINWEAEQYIPLPIKEVSLQYKVITKSNQNGKMNVLLTAAPKRAVEKYLKVIKNAGLKVVGLEPESSALGRVLTKTSDSLTIIVSLGAVSTDLVVASGGSAIFTRSISAGGSTLTRAIMSEFNLPQTQAEQYKQTYGILDDKLSGKVAAVIKPVIEILVQEILKSVEFAQSHLSANQISRVVVTGGGAFLPGLPQFLVERTSLEISVGDPWADFKKEGLILGLAGQGSLYSVATGLALWD